MNFVYKCRRTHILVSETVSALANDKLNKLELGTVGLGIAAAKTVAPGTVHSRWHLDSLSMQPDWRDRFRKSTGMESL